MVERQEWLNALFQFTPLREGRQKVREREGRGDEYFNSRPSARGDNVMPGLSQYVDLFQFTPLREGRHISRQS